MASPGVEPIIRTGQLFRPYLGAHSYAPEERTGPDAETAVPMMMSYNRTLLSRN